MKNNKVKKNKLKYNRIPTNLNQLQTKKEISKIYTNLFKKFAPT